METIFETKRLAVRKFREEDARPLYENHMDEEVRTVLNKEAEALGYEHITWMKTGCVIT